MSQYFLKRSLHSLAVCVCCFLFNMITLAPFEKAYAQNDNSRWDNVKAWKGTINITGAYQGSHDFWDEVTIQHSMSCSVNLSDATFAYFFGIWSGDITISYSIYEKYVKHNFLDCDGDRYHTDDWVETVKGSGSLSTSQANAEASLSIKKQNGVYAVALEMHLADVQTEEDCTPTTYDIYTSFNTYENLNNIPLPESGLTLSGNKKYSDTASFFNQPADYEVTWNLEPADATPTPTPTTTPTPTPTPEEKSKYDCELVACSIAVQSQTLGETIGIVGVPFSLKYQSDRVSGRSGTSSVAVSHAEEFGGWTLNVHHVYDPDGSGLFLGDGGHRDAEELGSVIQMNSTQTGFSVGDYIIAAEDGSEVYVFDSSGKHQRTVDPYTKATRYQFAYGQQRSSYYGNGWRRQRYHH